MTAQPWAIEFQNEWGVPDWHDESQYPAPGDLPAELWRWQFIRRMGDYREAIVQRNVLGKNTDSTRK